MIYYLTCLPDEAWWGGVVAHGMQMPLTKSSDYELNGTINRTDNQYNALFVSSCGRYIYVENGCILRFEAGGQITLSEVKGTADISEGHGTLKGALRAASAKHLAHGKAVPEEMILRPQYSTWVEMLRNVSSEKLERYAGSIIESGMDPGIMIVDDGWMRDYGDWRFDESKIADPEGLMKHLHELGFKLVLWVCPFVNEAVPDFQELAKSGALVRDRTGKIAMRRWWNGTSAVLDMSSPAAQTWLRSQLDALKAMGTDGFKFDAGDAGYYDSDDLTYGNVTPNDQSKLWAQFAAEYEYSELRACVGLGGYPVMQRLADKNSCWEGKSGILSLIPNMLQAGLSGYPYCCPDMVGGGQEADFGDGRQHDDELMVRSCQCAALMPSIQFSYAVWNRSSKDVRSIVRNCVRLRAKYGGYLRSLLAQAAKLNDPIMRHMEYEFPAQGLSDVSDQFMLGDKLLVAPVLYKGMRERSVILPSGCRWKYVPDGAEYEGGQTVRVGAPLEVLPYFERL